MDSGYLKGKVKRMNGIHLKQLQYDLKQTVFHNRETQGTIDKILVDIRLMMIDVECLLKLDVQHRFASSAKQKGDIRGYKNGKTLYKK